MARGARRACPVSRVAGAGRRGDEATWRPDLAIGTTPLVQQAKEIGIPAIYFTNMVSARPLFGPAGAGALASIVAAQTRGKERFARMVAFFDTVGTGENTGYGWTGRAQGASRRQGKLSPRAGKQGQGRILRLGRWVAHARSRP